MFFKRVSNPPESYLPLSEKQKEHVSLFNEKILSGAVKFELVSCLCGNKEFKLLARYDRYSMLQDTVICKKCGLILSNPRMTDDEYKRFYETDTYRRCYEPFNYLEGYVSRYNVSTGKHIFDIVAKVKDLSRIRKVMEFGAGGGWNLVVFKEKGIDVTGYDYSPSLVDLGKKHGINMLQGTIDSITGKFDLIILSHVIEHFTDLINSMKKLKEHLNPGGIFYIEVPDMKHFDIGQLQVAHTYHFTLPTLKFYMSECGLKLVHHEAAEGIHLGGIFTSTSEPLKTDFLKNEYDEMSNLVRNYYMRRSLSSVLDRLGLKEKIKKILKK